jgi:hypothetical protein
MVTIDDLSSIRAGMKDVWTLQKGRKGPLESVVRIRKRNVLFDFLQFVWSQVTSTKIYEIFRRSQGHKGSIQKVLINLTPKIRSGRPCGAVSYKNFRKSHRSQARIRKDHFVFGVTRQSAVRIERNGTVHRMKLMVVMVAAIRAFGFVRLARRRES